MRNFDISKAFNGAADRSDKITRRAERLGAKLATYAVWQANQGRLEEELPAKVHRFSPRTPDLPEGSVEVAQVILVNEGLAIEYNKSYICGAELGPFPNHSIVIHLLD